MPLCVFDIYPDGTAEVPQDESLTGPGTYRWWHFDLADPALPGWVAANLPPIPAGALLQPETRPRCDRFADGIILNLRGINLNAGEDADEMVSVRLWVDSDVIITVRMRKVFTIDDIRRQTEADNPPPTTADFLEVLISRLTQRIEQEVVKIADITEFYEDDLEDETTPIPKDLSETRRRVIRLRRYLEPQQAALDRLIEINMPIIPEPDTLRIRESANRTTIAVEELNALRERLITVQDEHDLYVARKQARHGYVLSIAAAVFLPLSFLTGLFGVNVGGMPGVGSPWAFTLLCLGMTLLVLVLLVLLKWLRWL
ncbi:CorA family divalent cation transporter [Sulfitobacter aestuarii]|uniref:CorA family divalent cation transporter n=1 Tax=Sulfitobacter aestuarii TaxID=2161676 RepID=A0ABW5U0H3_9RHOB